MEQKKLKNFKNFITESKSEFLDVDELVTNYGYEMRDGDAGEEYSNKVIIDAFLFASQDDEYPNIQDSFLRIIDDLPENWMKEGVKTNIIERLESMLSDARKITYYNIDDDESDLRMTRRGDKNPGSF